MGCIYEEMQRPWDVASPWMTPPKWGVAITGSAANCHRSMTSARRTIRHRRRIRVTVGTTPVFTADIGPGGFSAELMRVQPPGTVVQGSIRLSGHDVGYAGEIAWAKAGAPHMALRGRIGVRFTTLPAEARALLAATSLVS